LLAVNFHGACSRSVMLAIKCVYISHHVTFGITIFPFSHDPPSLKSSYNFAQNTYNANPNPVAVLRWQEILLFSLSAALPWQEIDLCQFATAGNPLRFSANGFAASAVVEVSSASSFATNHSCNSLETPPRAPPSLPPHQPRVLPPPCSHMHTPLPRWYRAIAMTL
jgi:hypothetical protein